MRHHGGSPIPPRPQSKNHPLREPRLPLPSEGWRSKTQIPATSSRGKRPRSVPAPMASADPIARRELEDLIHRLRQYRTPCLPDEDRKQADKAFRPRRAAVLVCLFEDDAGALRVILTKRSSRLSTHSGEVSLPGGKREEGDADDCATALREASEEIGLDPALVTVVAALEPFLSKHLLKVVPIIAILVDKQAFKPIVNTNEVDDIFDAPLEMFLKDQNRRCDEREWMGSKFVVQYFDYETEDKRKFLIWGLTASILVRAASVVFGRPPAFMELNPIFRAPSCLDGQNSLP